MLAPMAVIGDVHGEAELLERVFETLTGQDIQVVLLGDYINRGDNAKRVLDQLIEFKAQHTSQVILLRGNHEQALLNYLTTGDLPDFVAHGGFATIRSYVPTITDDSLTDFRTHFPSHHLDLIESTEDFYEDEDVLISHSGFNPADPQSRRPEDMRGLGFPEIFSYKGTWPKPLTVCGHYLQRNNRSFISEHLICIDTGCGTMKGAPLSVLFLPGRIVRTF
jgi:serine/threonine protein phosphatase 1